MKASGGYCGVLASRHPANTRLDEASKSSVSAPSRSTLSFAAPWSSLTRAAARARRMGVPDRSWPQGIDQDGSLLPQLLSLLPGAPGAADSSLQDTGGGLGDSLPLMLCSRSLHCRGRRKKEAQLGRAKGEPAVALDRRSLGGAVRLGKKEA